MTKDRKIYAVLAGTYRGNVLWYDTKLLEKNGIKVGNKMTFDEFFAAYRATSFSRLSGVESKLSIEGLLAHF